VEFSKTGHKIATAIFQNSCQINKYIMQSNNYGIRICVSGDSNIKYPFLLTLISAVLKDGNSHHIAKTTLLRAIMFTLLDSLLDSDIKGGIFDLQQQQNSRQI